MSAIMVKDRCTLQELKDIPIPVTTETYTPVPYGDYVQSLLDLAEEKVGAPPKSRVYGTARAGGHMFGLHVYNTWDSETDLAVGFRTSYNKQLSNTVAIGSQVIVCSNLMLTGDIYVMRKHTSGVLNDLEELLVGAFDNVNEIYGDSVKQRKLLKDTIVPRHIGHRILGDITGRRLIGFRQFKKAMKEFDNPSHKAHGNLTAWTLYQACTEAMKTTQGGYAIEKYSRLHDFFKGEFDIESRLN